MAAPTEKDHEQDQRHFEDHRSLADSDLDAVSGGDGRTDPGDDDDKMSGGELAALYHSKFGFKLQQAW